MNDLVFEPDPQPPAHPALPPWPILVADDDPGVHTVTALALQDYQFEGRGVTIIDAHSGEEALAALDQHPDIAVLLLDVVMESRQAGLEVVSHIRQVQQNAMVRIIIRTGQPGDFPEQELINTYDINDYREKTELTVQKLRTSLTAALRAYRDLLTIKNSATLLKSITQAGTRLIAATTLPELTEVFLDNFDKLLGSSAHILLYQFDRQGQTHLLARRGRFTRTSPEALETYYHRHSAQDQFSATSCSRLFDTRLGRSFGFLAEWVRPLSGYEQELIPVYLQKADAIFVNLDLIMNLEQRQAELAHSLRERDLLIKEIHHRVKNNLQIISSLLSVEAEDIPGGTELPAFRDTRNRILSMALVHEKLYQSKDLARIDFGAYAGSLSHDLAFTFGLHNQLKINLPKLPVLIGINQAVPLGLLINEILTVTAKHPFGSPRPPINLTITAGPPISLIVEIFDADLRLDFAPPGPTSLEARLIRLMSEQIKGQLQLDFLDGRTLLRLNFFPD